MNCLAFALCTTPDHTVGSTPLPRHELSVTRPLHPLKTVTPNPSLKPSTNSVPTDLPHLRLISQQRWQWRAFGRTREMQQSSNRTFHWAAVFQCYPLGNLDEITLRHIR